MMWKEFVGLQHHLEADPKYFFSKPAKVPQEEKCCYEVLGS